MTGITCQADIPLRQQKSKSEHWLPPLDWAWALPRIPDPSAPNLFLASLVHVSCLTPKESEFTFSALVSF